MCCAVPQASIARIGIWPWRRARNATGLLRHTLLVVYVCLAVLTEIRARCIIHQIGSKGTERVEHTLPNGCLERFPDLKHKAAGDRKQCPRLEVRASATICNTNSKKMCVGSDKKHLGITRGIVGSISVHSVSNTTTPNLVS